VPLPTLETCFPGFFHMGKSIRQLAKDRGLRENDQNVETLLFITLHSYINRGVKYIKFYSVCSIIKELFIGIKKM
jgi:hypothetical protein